VKKKKQISVHDVIIKNISSKQQVDTLTRPQNIRHLPTCLFLAVGSARESNSDSFSDKWNRQWHLALQTKNRKNSSHKKLVTIRRSFVWTLLPSWFLGVTQHVNLRAIFLKSAHRSVSDAEQDTGVTVLLW